MNKKAFALGILASLFFATTFILNRSMQLGGGSFFWTASLRFLFMFPCLLSLVALQRGHGRIIQEIKRHPKEWFLWSFVGFGVFYFFLSWGADHGSSWLVVGAWQITIVMGVLLTPLFNRHIPRRALFISILIVAGVFLIVYENAVEVSLYDTVFALVTITIAGIAYPLGNRKLMALDHDLSTIERVYAMTICSAPFWVLVSCAGYIHGGGFPSASQTFQGAMVGIFSGTLATLLFFHATDLSKFNEKALAITESTIAGEVVFTLLGGIIFLHDPIPGVISTIGLLIIIVAMAFNR